MVGRMKTANYTERALAGVTMPKFVYVPLAMRPGKADLRVEIDKQTINNNHKRIAEADPLGFYIAIMNGQPVPQFRVEYGELKLEYALPTMEQRMRAAEWLGARVTFKVPSAYKNQGNLGRAHEEAHDYNRMIEEANELEEAPAAK